jgi:ketosteroid isomerase-like protein
MPNSETVIQALGDVFSDEETEVDEALVERMIRAISTIAADDLVMRMYGPDDSFVGTYEGADGVRAGWADWLDSFEQVRFRLEAIEDVGENVLTFARQIGTTRTGGVEIEQPSAAVWKFREGRLAEVEFHLNRDRARQSAEAPADG